MEPLVDGHIPQAKDPRETGGFYAIGDTNVNPIRPIQQLKPGQNDPIGTHFRTFRGPNQRLSRHKDLFALVGFPGSVR
jgi:hypothetical protein